MTSLWFYIKILKLQLKLSFKLLGLNVKYQKRLILNNNNDDNNNKNKKDNIIINNKMVKHFSFMNSETYATVS